LDEFELWLSDGVPTVRRKQIVISACVSVEGEAGNVRPQPAYQLDFISPPPLFGQYRNVNADKYLVTPKV
jgi:hypothetical protein